MQPQTSFLVFLPILILLGLLCLGMVIPLLYGLPWRATSAARIRRALTMAQAKPGEVVYDLGSGDGRVLIQAAEEFQAKAVGIEVNPWLCLAAWVKIHRRRLGGRISLRWGDCFHASLREADVVVAYMTSAQAQRLQKHLEEQLPPGARVVTIAFELPGWQPVLFDREHLLYLYQMPS